MDLKIQVKACIGSALSAYRTALEALEADDMPRMYRWLRVVLKSEEAMFRLLETLDKETGDPEIRKFLKEGGN